MNRREALRTLAAASGGLVALPGWALGWSPNQLPIPSTAFSASEQATLSAIADTIIPERDSVGALALGVDRFLIGLLERCYDREVQEKVRTQVGALDRLAREGAAESFRKCGREQRERLLLSLAGSGDAPARDFFALIKAETIRGFRTSRVVMERYLGYTVMPGFYDGCAEVKTT